MNSIETTEMKLRSTPTGGVSSEHSPYYRRLLSAGYKGFLQGTIGGAGLYGTIGAAIGLCVAIPAAVALGPTAFLLIPAAGATGLLKGASTFGNIGTVAAISAESAELAEQRRYLLDRYYELPEGPEGDRQATLIKKELESLQHSGKKHPLFHWKTVAVCAAIGGAIALALSFPPLLTVVGHSGLIAEMLETIGMSAHAIGAPAFAAIGTGIGALMGSVIGLDRHYVRKWFDGSEKILHDEGHSQEAAEARTQQIARLKEAARIDNETKMIMERRRSLGMDAPNQAPNAGQAVDPLPPKSIASLDMPDTKVQEAMHLSRLSDKPLALSV